MAMSSGSWLARHLVETYHSAYKVVCFDKLDYCASLANIQMLDSRTNFSFYHGNILNSAEVAQCISQNNVDTIFHFAAMSHVDLSFRNSMEFTTTNVLGTHVILECARYAGIKRFIHISTDEVYGEVEDDGEDLVEPSILAPTNPYAASKAGAEMLVHAYWKSFKLPVIVVRCNNVYGPHQYPESLSPISTRSPRKYDIS
jgi:dTDP-D-glucose 4,6-dehydratase